jgi:O-methyltransferase
MRSAAVATLKINPELRVSWKSGRPFLAVPGQPLQELHGDGGLDLLSEFKTPRSVQDVIAEYEDSATAERAVRTLFRAGALIFETATSAMPADLRFAEMLFHEIQAAAETITMGTPALNYALFKAVEYISRSEIDGAVVESGVWKGGSAVICAMTLLALGDTDREIYLFDSFDGTWPEPNPEDGTIYGRSYEDTMRMHASAQTSPPDPAELAREGVDSNSVRARLEITGYPMDKVHLVQGRILETIPKLAPEQIALLRLDTDFYESTCHELRHLYPRISPGGVLIVDDYPTEMGATRAVDEYFTKSNERILLNRIDIQGRIAVRIGH